MRSIRFSWLLAVLALLPACSLLVDFDEEGQPCDPRGQCLPNYTCREGVCVSEPGAGTDGGTGGSSLCEAPEGCKEQPPEAR